MAGIKIIKKKDLQYKEDDHNEQEILKDAEARVNSSSRGTAEFRAPKAEEPDEVQKMKDWVNESLLEIEAKKKAERENLFGGGLRR